MQFQSHIDKSFWITADKLSFALYGVVFTLLVIRHLSPVEYASYVLIYQSLFMMIVAVISSFSLQPLFKYASETEYVKPIISIAFVLLAISSVFFCIIPFVFQNHFESWFNTPGLNSLIRYVPFLVVSFVFRLFFQYIFQSKYRLKEVFIVNCFFMVISTGWLIVLIAKQSLYSAEQVLIILFVCSGLATLISFWFGREYIKLIGEWNSGVFKKMFVFGTYGIANTSSFFMFGYLDNYLIAIFSSVEQVALYGVVKIFCRIFDLFTQIAQSLLIPTVSKMSVNRDFTNLKIVFEKAVGFSTIVLIPIAVMFLFFGQPLFYICFGGKYYDGILLLQVFSLLAFTTPWSAVIGSYYVGLAKLNIAIIINVAYMILNIILYFLLIPPFGALGAAIASVGSVFFINFIHWAVMKKWIHYDFKGIFYRYKDMLEFIKTLRANQ